MSNNNQGSRARSGFTLVEMLIIAPIVLLTIGAFITVIVNMTGDVLASRSATVLTYNIQDALNRIEDDVKLSTTFLATNNVTLTSPQGYSDDTTAFNNVDATNGTMLILNTLATNGNPLVSTSGLVYLTNLPNACNSTQLSQNTPLTFNIVYFVRNGTLWRRTVMPSTYATSGCSVPWQQPSCNPALASGGTWGSYTFCKTQDIRLVDNIASGGFSVSYFNTADATVPNTVASDISSNSTVRGSALQSLSTVGASITVSTTAAGRSISQSGSLRVTKLDINASTIAPVVVATIPSAPVVSASLSSPNQAVFTWPTVAGATGYTFQYQANGTGGAWTTAFTNTNTTIYTVTGNHGDVIYGQVSATNSAGTSTYSSPVSLTIPIWATPQMQNGWTDFQSGYASASYTKTSSGLIVLKGMIKAGTVGQVVFTLPAGYRPPQNYLYQSVSNSANARIDVYTTGNVVVTTGNNAWVTLDNIRFMPAGTTFNAVTPASSPYSNGWVNYGDPNYVITPTYANVGSDRIEVRGMIAGGTTTDGTAMFTLPVSARPNQYFHLPADASGNNGTVGIAASDGTVQAKGNSNTWLSIHAIFMASSRASGSTCTTQWCSLTLQNSWAFYGAPYGVPEYTKASDGMVHLKGLIKSGTTTAGTIVTSIPAGYRPASELVIENQSNGAIGRVDITAAGNVTFWLGTNTWFSLDGVSYLAEQ